MTEKLNAKRVSLSLAAVAGIISIICALLILIAPQATMNLFGAIFHGIDLSQISKTATLGSSILGIIEAMILGWIAGWLFAVVYNKMK